MERRHSTSEQFPPLSFEKSRSREWDCYTDEQRASVVYHWLRDGMTTRQMDIQLLGQNPDGSSKGWQSKGIYSYLGLNKEHQGFFKGWTISEIVGYFHSQHSEEQNGIWTKPRDFSDVKVPMNDFIQISSDLRKALHVDLLGFDVIIDKNNKFWIIDLNYFPGYKHVDNLWPKFLNFIMEKLGLPKR